MELLQVAWRLLQQPALLDSSTHCFLRGLAGLLCCQSAIRHWLRGWLQGAVGWQFTPPLLQERQIRLDGESTACFSGRVCACLRVYSAQQTKIDHVRCGGKLALHSYGLEAMAICYDCMQGPVHLVVGVVQASVAAKHSYVLLV